jgi:Arabinogalactan peptide
MLLFPGQSINAGTTVDQGIAYMLMLVALVLTYLIHPLGTSSSSSPVSNLF